MTPPRPRALDLFCCAGGATRGLQRAGFHVTGVDIKPQPRYCGDAFIQADALQAFLQLDDFDFIWASPPCQRYTRVWTGRDEERLRYPDLVAATRHLLSQHTLTVIENVVGAPVRADLVLTGAHFGLPLIRTRVFEIRGFSIPLFLTPPHAGSVKRGDLACVVGHGAQNGWRRPGEKWRDLPDAIRLKVLARNNRAGWSEALGSVEWMTRAEMAQAIPPAYSEFIGRAALAIVRRDAPAGLAVA